MEDIRQKPEEACRLLTWHAVQRVTLRWWQGGHRRHGRDGSGGARGRINGLAVTGAGLDVPRPRLHHLLLLLLQLLLLLDGLLFLRNAREEGRRSQSKVTHLKSDLSLLVQAQSHLLWSNRDHGCTSVKKTTKTAVRRTGYVKIQYAKLILTEKEKWPIRHFFFYLITQSVCE